MLISLNTPIMFMSKRVIKLLNTIISALRIGGDTALYKKLLSYKLNYHNKEKQEDK